MTNEEIFTQNIKVTTEDLKRAFEELLKNHPQKSVGHLYFNSEHALWQKSLDEYRIGKKIW